MPLFSFHEPFINTNEHGLPCSISVEQNSAYTHKHIRWENEVCYVCCEGNKLFAVTPGLTHCEVSFRFRFHNTYGRHGCALYARYDRMLRTGLAVELTEEKDACLLALYHIDREDKNLIQSVPLDIPALPEENTLQLSLRENALTVRLNGAGYRFEEALCPAAGEVGFTFIGAVGEMAALDLTISSDDPLPIQTLLPEASAEIPLRNGGNIPYRLTWSIVRYGSVSYLKYRLSGGAQDRPLDPAYPRETGQYTVEQTRITRPYAALYAPDGRRLCRCTLFPGRLTVTDPGLHWKELLRDYFRITDLPLTGTLPLPDTAPARIAYGYEACCAGGYRMQKEENVEFAFDVRSGALLYEGPAPQLDALLITSPQDKRAVQLIPDDAYDAGQLRRHMAENHYFAEDEPIRFSVTVQSSKPAAYMSCRAMLLTVYGDPIVSLTGVKDGDAWHFAHEPLSVGVYRLSVTALFGDQPLCRREVVFEVFDPAGQRCAPLESGLPFLYSMPNEQRYLDRDAFDPWSPFPGCDMEHFYACSSFTGDIAMKKRIWEIIRRFGRKWYVWNGGHRTLTAQEMKDWQDDILRFSDYCYYPLRHEWAVCRHDFTAISSYRKTGLIDDLRDFLRIHPEIGIELTPDAEELTEEQFHTLMLNGYQKWIDFAVRRICADARQDNQRMRALNPSIKRASYGPFPIYAYPLTTHNSLMHVGFPADERLSDIFFDGFAQLEDYPYSCCYNTYKGPFLLSHVLLHVPNLHVYPEQYTASEGGCIDGAVKNANPPLGRYDMPGYFNVTHAYEYVYNTAHLTKDGFKFWENRGFMQRDFTPEFVDAFIRGWKHVLSHEPAAPLRSTAYISEMPAEENLIQPDGDTLIVTNRSDTGIAFVYETARTGGLPNGFTLRWEMLDALSPEMTDCIVLPSLKNAPEAAIERLRALYKQGISLIAVSHVDGLEDLFGVRPHSRDAVICRLKTPDGQCENAFPESTCFLYEATDAEVLLTGETAEGEAHPVLMAHDRTLILNAPVSDLNRQTFPKAGLHKSYQPSLSVLLRQTLTQRMRRLSNPVALSDHGGLTLFRDRQGHTLLLAIDYSPYELNGVHRQYESVISFNDVAVKSISCIYGPQPSVLRDENGDVRGLYLKLHQQECALLQLS